RSPSIRFTPPPLAAMNSFGAYVASAATVRVPFDLRELGTSAATDGSVDVLMFGVAVRVVLVGSEPLVLELLLDDEPHPAAMPATAMALTIASPSLVRVPLMLKILSSS